MRILLLLILIINPLVSASELTTNANNSGTVTFTYNNGNTGYAYNSTGDKFLLAGHQGSHYAEYHNHRSHMKYDLTLLTGKKIRNATFSIKARTGFLRGGHSEYGPTYNIMLNQIENFDKLTWDPKLIEIINPKFVPHNSTGYGGLFKQNITKQLQKAIDNKEPYFALQMKSSYESTDNLYGSYESFENYPSISYTLNNLPEIEFISLQENQTIGRTKDINWTSQDKDKDNLNFSLYYSTEKGKKQHLIADTTRNQQLWAFENILTGEYYLTLTAKDGFDETINSIKITIDNTPPDTIAKYPEDLDNDELIINLTALDENSEIESIYYKIDDQNWVKGNQITIKKTGTHKINYYSEDIFGNKEKEKSIIIIKEKPKIIKPEIIPPRARGYFKPIVQSIDKKQLQARIQKLNKIVQNYTKNKVYLKPEKLEKILNLQNEVNDTKLIRQVDNYVKKLKLDDINIVKTKTQKGKLYTRTIELVEKKGQPHQTNVILTIINDTNQTLESIIITDKIPKELAEDYTKLQFYPAITTLLDQSTIQWEIPLLRLGQEIKLKYTTLGSKENTKFSEPEIIYLQDNDEITTARENQIFQLEEIEKPKIVDNKSFLSITQDYIILPIAILLLLLIKFHWQRKQNLKKKQLQPQPLPRRPQQSQ